MFGVAGQYLIDFAINNVTVPLQIGGFYSFALVENVKLFVPQFKAVVYDTSGLLDSTYNPIQDGSPVTLSLGLDANDFNAPTAYNFRLFGLPKQLRIGNRDAYSFIGAFDSYLYWRGIPKKIFTGTSNQALAEICKDCGLTPDLDTTNDAMNWLITRRPYSSVARYIADHGYVDDNSIMYQCLNIDGVMRYRDMAKLAKKDAVFTFCYGNPANDGLPYTSILGNYFMRNKSGLHNLIFKYGTRVTRENLDGSASVYNKANVTLMSNNLDVSSDLYNQLGNVRNEYAPPDAGNTHDKFRQAEYQNRQGHASYSTTVYVMTTTVAPLSLLDVVNVFISDNGDSNLPAVYNGKYIVTAKTRYVSGTQYYEKYELSTQGPQIDPGNLLIG